MTLPIFLSEYKLVTPARKGCPDVLRRTLPVRRSGCARPFLSLLVPAIVAFGYW